MFSSGIVNSAGGVLTGQYGIDIGGTAGAVTSSGGGISNYGLISVSVAPIDVLYDPTFSGGITNSGTLSGEDGIYVFDVTSFANGITNSGTISASADSGIALYTISTFTGGITNSGTIAAGSYGIIVGVTTGFAYPVSTFSGNISNSGTISAATAIAIGSGTIHGSIIDSGLIDGTALGIRIEAHGAIEASTGNAISISGPTFLGGISSGGITNAGLITAATGILIGGYANVSRGASNTASVTIATFGGGITNAGTITAANDGILIGGTVTVGGVTRLQAARRS